MPPSEAFKAALRKSHTAISKVSLHRGTETLVDNLPVLSGEVTDDASAQVRRRCGLQLPGTSEIMDLLTASPPSEGGLWPVGNELKLFGGIRYPATSVSVESEELIPMGVFRISKPNVSDSGSNLTVSIEGFDRSRAVSRAGFTQPYRIAAGTNYSTAIQDLIEYRAPWLLPTDFVFMATSFTTPGLIFTEQDDPWVKAQEMASSFGAEVLFDGDGRCVLQPQPDPQFTPSSFDYIEGEQATLTSLGRDLDDQEAYNGVVILAESSDLPYPLRAEAWDTNPASPTYFDPALPSASIYGPVPKIVTSQYITTQSQANQAAAAEFARVNGVIEKIDFTAINNPSHFSGDVIQVTRARAHVNALYVLDSINIGLGANSSMSGTTRKRRTAV